MGRGGSVFGDVHGACARLELLPLLREAANRPMVAAEITEALRDGGLLEDALGFMETAEFQNWEGGEVAGLLWSSVVGALALRHAREGHAEASRAMAARMFAYPEGLHFGRRVGQSQAEHRYALGQVYRLTGDFDKSLDAFRMGAREGGVPSIAQNPEAMRWVNLCQEALREI